MKFGEQIKVLCKDGHLQKIIREDFFEKCAKKVTDFKFVGC